MMRKSYEKMPLLIEQSEPMALYTSHEPKILKNIQMHFDVKSLLIAVIMPNIGTNWIIGVHQCDHERIWDK